MAPAVVVMMLTLLLGVQPVTTDLYLPALQTLQHDLGATFAAVWCATCSCRTKGRARCHARSAARA